MKKGTQLEACRALALWAFVVICVNNRSQSCLPQLLQKDRQGLSKWLRPWLPKYQGKRRRSTAGAQGANTGHENTEGMACVGARLTTHLGSGAADS